MTQRLDGTVTTGTGAPDASGAASAVTPAQGDLVTRAGRATVDGPPARPTRQER
jgi:hypothetical protein